jgi:hypothetical protein
VGGVFLSGGNNSYTLPEKYVRVRTDLPFTQSFDSTTAPFNTNTLIKAQAFQDTFVDRYAAAFAALRAKADTFTGEYLFNV